MAIWQWNICIVPKQEIINQLKEIPQQMDLNSFDASNWWKDLSRKELVNFFSSILPDYYTPWAEYSQSWGSDNEDRITIMVDNNIVEDIGIRIDLRNLNINLLRSLISFCQRRDFLFYSIETGKFIEPDFEILVREIMSSRKMGFMENPINFFEDDNYLDKINKENLRKLDSDL